MKYRNLYALVTLICLTIAAEAAPKSRGSDDSAVTNTNQDIVIDVLANDRGRNLTLTDVQAPTVSGSSAIINADNTSVTYTPQTDYAGNDSFSYSFVDSRGRPGSAEVSVTVNGVSDDGGSDGGDDNSGLVEFDLIPIQKGVMYETHFQYDGTSNWRPETGGHAIYDIAAAQTGATQLQVNNETRLASDLNPNQVVTYIGVDGEFYTSTVSTINNTIVNLNQPIQVDIRAGTNLQNFYADATHPHVGGLYAVVDFALRELNDPLLDGGRHVLLGDSWFDPNFDFVKQRLDQRLPNSEVISLGVGGNKASDMLARFEQDITPLGPDVVWLIAGTNDYFANGSTGVPVDEFVENMRSIIEKINAIGARAIVFDPPVGSLQPQPIGDLHVRLSKEYSAGLAAIRAP